MSTSSRAISPLRQRMIDDMTAPQLGLPAQRFYIRSCQRFAAFLGRSPESATAEDIRRSSWSWPRAALASRNGTPS
jgi:integrase/recombinase XerD